MDNIGNRIAAANTAPDAETFARIIFAALFETGPNRLSGPDAYLARTAIRAAALEWQKQLLSSAGRDVSRWKKLYEDTKRELDDVRLKLAVLQKEL